MNEALQEAKARAGGAAALARMLGVSAAAVKQWQQAPPHWVLDIETHTGISRSRLRPDLYPEKDYG